MPEMIAFFPQSIKKYKSRFFEGSASDKLENLILILEQWSNHFTWLNNILAGNLNFENFFFFSVELSFLW